VGASRDIFIGGSKQRCLYWWEQVEISLLVGASRDIFIGGGKLRYLYWWEQVEISLFPFKIIKLQEPQIIIYYVQKHSFSVLNLQRNL